MLTDSELAEIERRLNATTPGEWSVDRRVSTRIHLAEMPNRGIGTCGGYFTNDEPERINAENAANAVFIASSHQDVPRLTDTVRSQQSENARLREALTRLDVRFGWHREIGPGVRAALAGGGTEEEGT